ncbi:MAG TPA: sensor histidine kinase KdpD [Gemmatimonadales bacterium]|nr:sensor histidine kinase KdpD [Gemmatimonadales bacterium]
MTGTRPDPDALLARIQQEESRSRRGRLKVFVGASPGVGKTFSMLEAARAARLGGRDVVVGVVETHGRRETAALVDGLDVLPPKAFPHRGVTLEEFDLDAALTRRPSLILVDEMAHSNAPGARHAKRYQDIDELLRAGIDVFTTLNIQHLESLNDVVAQITGVTVRETVPDAVLDEADEIELVDVTPEVLEQRLREGKVYLPEQAKRALDRFFRRGNLIALRELALRRTAERVDEQMRGYRASAGIAEPWAASERLLVCVSPSERSLRLVRSARRLAGLLRAPWTALYVELPRHATMPAQNREAAQEALRLGEELGGTAVSVPGHDAAEEILAYARSHNVTRILVGRSRRGWLAGLFPASVAGRLVRGAEGMHIWVGADEEREPASEPPPRNGLELGPLRHYAGAAFVVALMTAVAVPFHGTLAEIDAAMLYLLAVVVAAARYGRGPSVLAGLLAVACFDIVFVRPYGTFAVSDVRYILTFVMMLVVALVMGGLTTRVREQASVARLRERRASTLYAVSRDLAAARTRPELGRVTLRHLHDLFGGSVMLILPDLDGRLDLIAEMPVRQSVRSDLGVAKWVFEHAEPAGLGTQTLPAADAMYVPLATAERVLGVVGLRPEPVDRFGDPAQRQLLESLLGQAAVALERTALAEEKRIVHLEYEAEQMRTSLLSSLSHDLRTPLGGIEGAASSLVEDQDQLSRATRRELAQSILDESRRMTRMVANLLDMVRVESGALGVHREWHVLEEVVGVALLRVGDRLDGRSVTTDLPAGLPLVSIDDVLIEQVLINLLENVAKYTPAGSPVEISAALRPDEVLVTVADRGPGVPDEERERIFEKFHRAARGAGGIGLGLAICRGIIMAHGGRLWVDHRLGGGAAFRFTLPIVGVPPAFDQEPDVEAVAP